MTDLIPFYPITLRKAKYFFRAILLFASINIGFAQNFTQSPYSKLGIGEPFFQGFAQQMGLGYQSQAYRDQLSFAISNPASYSALQKTSYQFGAFANTGKIADNTISQNVYNASLAYLSMAFQINKKKDWGVAFGILPYSSTGYTIKNDIDSSFGRFSEYYEGKGGVTRAFVGTGKKVGRALSLGLNTSYLFGKKEIGEALVYDNTTPYVSYRNSVTNYLGGFHFQGGAQLVLDSFNMKTWGARLFKRLKMQHIVGVTYEAQGNLNSSSDYFTRSVFNGQNSGFTKDTILLTTDVQGDVTLPSSLAFGYMLQPNDNRWRLGFEYRMINAASFSSSLSQDKLINYQRWSLGGSFIPAKDMSAKGNFLSRTEYRMGIHGGNTGILIKDTEINEIGINLGFGFPLRVRTVNEEFRYEFVYSRLNLNFEYIQKGTLNNNLIKENYLRLTVGVSLNDKWFNRRKIE